MLASLSGLGAILKNAQVEQQELITELFSLHELILFPISTDDIASLWETGVGKV